LSISASSFSVNARFSSAATLASSCATLLAPTSVEVIRGSRSVQASASCASDWPRRAAISFNARTLDRFSSFSHSGGSVDARLARDPSGTPPR
jgi:hypothetical protein